MVDTFKKAGVEVAEMSKDDTDAWLAVAKQSSYKKFAEDVKGGEELIEEALAVKYIPMRVSETGRRVPRNLYPAPACT